MTPGTSGIPYEPSRDRRIAWVMLAVAIVIGGWLAWEIERTIGLSSPRLWELLRTDRVFDLAMLDFLLTATWGFLVIGERANWKGWRFWLSASLFFVVPTLGICLFVLLQRRTDSGGDRANPPVPTTTLES